MKWINVVIYGFFLDILGVVSVLLIPVTAVVTLFLWIKGHKKDKCIVCKEQRRRIDDDGICTHCNAALDELYDDIRGTSDSEPDNGVPWASLEVIPVGGEEKQMADIDIRIDSGTGIPYIYSGDVVYKMIGNDGFGYDV